MSTIRFVPDDGERTVVADRVMSDSKVFVAERRADGQWLRVLTVALGWYDDRHQLVVVDGDAPVPDVGVALVRGVQEWLLRRRLAF